MSLHAIDGSCRRALIFTPMETDRQVLVGAAILAEQLGYEAVVVPEGWGLDAGIVLAEIAVRTEQIRLVSGVFSVWGRSTATLAMAAATLDDLSGGRFTLGLGASTAALAERFHDAAFTRPTSCLREAATGARALLDGQRVTTWSGGTGLALGRPPRHRVPIWLAALGPRSVRLATEIADGWIPALLPRSRVEDARWRALDTAKGDPELICGPMGALAATPASSRQAAEQMVGWYLTGMGPFYGDFVARNGFGAEIEAIRAANPKPRPGGIEWPPEADPLLAELAVFGEPDEIARQLACWDQLVDIVAVGVGPAPLESVEALVRAAAPPA